MTPPLTITRLGSAEKPAVTHEETAGGYTACGKRLGKPGRGWVRDALSGVTCRECKRVRAEAERYLEAGPRP